MSEVATICNEVNENPSVHFSNRDVKLFLVNKYGDRGSFSTPSQANKSALFYLDTVSPTDMADTIQDSDPVKDAAKMLRQTILPEDFELQDRFCDANDLKRAMNNIVIPNNVLLVEETKDHFGGFFGPETYIPAQ